MPIKKNNAKQHPQKKTTSIPEPIAQPKDYQLRAQIAKALAHPSRMLIVDALQKRELCVCELTALIGCDQSTVSKHLTILKAVGLIEDRKQGTNIYYRLLCPCIQQFLNCMEEVAAANLKKYQGLVKPTHCTCKKQ